MTAEHADIRKSADRVRVVLLGRTGLEAALRDESRVDLVRVRSPLEAVGEVAAPPASAGGTSTVVLVGRDGEPASHREAFLAALREADPHVRLVRIESGGAVRPEEVRPYDAVLRDGATGEALRAVLGGDEPRMRAADAAETMEPGGPDEIEDEPQIVISTEGVELPGPKPTLPGDGALVDAMRQDRTSFLRAAQRLLKERAGPDVRFVTDADARGAAVGKGDARYGVLVGGAADRLGPHAAWLAGWICLYDSQQALRRAAYTDSLTGAWNRRYFEQFLEAAISRARRGRRTVTVLVFDIDEFKQYNDKFGHPAGDDILIETVRALKSSVRPSDRVCRIGGDEFAVIFDEPQGPREQGSRPPESVYVLARRVQKKIGERKFPKLGSGAPGPLTISGGLAAYPWDGHDSETLLSRADELACQSKRQGKNAITLGPGAERVCKGADDCED